MAAGAEGSAPLRSLLRLSLPRLRSSRRLSSRPALCLALYLLGKSQRAYPWGAFRLDIGLPDSLWDAAAQEIAVQRTEKGSVTGAFQAGEGVDLNALQVLCCTHKQERSLCFHARLL